VTPVVLPGARRHPASEGFYCCILEGLWARMFEAVNPLSVLRTFQGKHRDLWRAIYSDRKPYYSKATRGVHHPLSQMHHPCHKP
jgi:hypothetical protein